MAHLITTMLHPQPSNRPTAEQLVRHPLLSPHLSPEPVRGVAGVAAVEAMEKMILVLKEELALATSKLTQSERR